MPHVFKFVQGGSTLVDFNDGSHTIGQWKPALVEDDTYVEDELLLNLSGSSADNLNDLFIGVARLFESGADNFARYQAGYRYTPIFLQYQHTSGSNLVQSEFFGGTLESPQDYLNPTIVSYYLAQLKLKLFRRAYFEETALVSVYSNATYAEGAAASLTTIRGDLPAPLMIQATPNTAGYDTLLACLRCIGTVANFQQTYEAENYGTSGGIRAASVADLSDTNLSPGGAGVTGQRWTPANTNEILLLRWINATNVGDQLGRFRVLVRCRDNNATPNVKIRVRAGIYAAAQFGDWGDVQKFVTTAGGTNPLAYVDCGVLNVPSVDLMSNAPLQIVYELWGQALATGAGKTFDIDCLDLFPVREGGFGSGYQYAQLGTTMNTTGTLDGFLDSNDRQPEAYLAYGLSGPLLQLGALDVRGQPLFIWPNRAQNLYLFSTINSTQQEKWNMSYNLQVWARPRYLIARGT